MAELNLQVILQQLQADKGIDEEILIEAIRSAIESAARRSFHPSSEIAVDIDLAAKEPFKVYEIREVAEEVEDEATQMTLEEALALNPGATIGARLKVPREPKDFGRIAAQTARQVVMQKMRDAEHDNVFDEYKSREGELITGVVKRIVRGTIIVSLGRAEAIIPQSHQSPRESFKTGDRIRGVLITVEKSPRGPELIISRTVPELVRLLFDLEVPEIFDGTVELRGVSREPGARTKIAVRSNDSNVDPVGACVGMRGARVRAVVEELSGEKIDIVRYSDDPVEFCGNALNPADILSITVDEETKGILVVVPEEQLSLAIGKRGQNARLASKLIGWNIDIKSDTQIAGTDVFSEFDAAHEEGEEAEASESEDGEAAVESAPEPASTADEPEVVEDNTGNAPGEAEPATAGEAPGDVDDDGTPVNA
jgi:N utilization substance protein A